MNRAILGLFGGFAATVPMSLVMLATRRLSAEHAAEELPPKQITDHAVRPVTPPSTQGRAARHAAAVASHFGFGSLAGSVYGPLSKLVPGNPLVKGAVYGTAVWTANYVGLLPLLRLQPHVTEQPTGRNPAMFVSHLVWGMSLGAFVHRFSSRPLKAREPRARRSAPRPGLASASGSL